MACPKSKTLTCPRMFVIYASLHKTKMLKPMNPSKQFFMCGDRIKNNQNTSLDQSMDEIDSWALIGGDSSNK